MDSAQAKATAALQPFVVEATTSKSPSPRYLSDLIIRAISAPGTYTFTELLQTPEIQSLQTANPEHKIYLTLLEQFSWGTYQEYRSISGLPQLTAVQVEKLRQLSLLSLASPFVSTGNDDEAPLTYSSLLTSLELKNNHELEKLVTSAIYAGLLTARLSPNSDPAQVLVTAVAPLRDPRPQSLAAMLQILRTWEGRCVQVISDLEKSIGTIRNHASQRTQLQHRRQEVIDTTIIRNENDTSKAARPRDRKGNKRDLDERMEGEFYEDASSDEAKMEVDDKDDTGPGTSHRGGLGGRGTKRNRGRGGGGGLFP